MGRSLESDVLFVAHRLRSEGEQTEEEIAIGCATIVDAVQLLLRRRSERRLGLADVRICRTLEREASKYTSSRLPQERWFGGHLAARPRVDRVPRLVEALKHATRLLQQASRTSAPKKWVSNTVRVMVSVVRSARVIKKTSAKTAASAEASLTRALTRKSKPGAAGKLTADLLLVAALKACGASHSEANDWCKRMP